MKKILLILTFALALVIPNAHGQGVALIGDNGKALDTVRNAATEHLTTPSMAKIGMAGKYDIQFFINNDSATTSATVYLEASNDNIHWERWGKIPGTDGINCDSLMVSGAKIHTFHVQAGIPKVVQGVTYYPNFGRRVYGRLTIVHAAGGRSSYGGSLVTSE